jgi:hypothetical protein
MFVSVTRLRMRLVRHLPLIWWNTYLMQRQVVRSAGFVGGRLLIDARRTYWTLTVWEDEKAMKAFRGSGTHASVMPRLPKWCDEAAYAHWETLDVSVPEWLEAHEHLVKDGKLSRVEAPSADHQSRRFPRPRLAPLIGTTMKPHQ